MQYVFRLAIFSLHKCATIIDLLSTNVLAPLYKKDYLLKTWKILCVWKLWSSANKNYSKMVKSRGDKIKKWKYGLVGNTYWASFPHIPLLPFYDSLKLLFLPDIPQWGSVTDTNNIKLILCFCIKRAKQ